MRWKPGGGWRGLGAKLLTSNIRGARRVVPPIAEISTKPGRVTYDVESLYLTLGGNLVGGEEWQFGTHWVATVPGISLGVALDNIGLDDIRDAAASWYGNTQNMFPNDCHFAWAKLAWIGLDGKYKTDSRMSELIPPRAGGSTGGGATSYAPVQTSLCVSLRTDLTLGDANRGRVYLPPIVYGRAPSTPGISAPTRTAVLNAFHAMMTQVSGEMFTVENGCKLAILSKKNDGKHRLVTKFMLGDIIDTQRRRRGQYVETYETKAWA